MNSILETVFIFVFLFVIAFAMRLYLSIQSPEMLQKMQKNSMEQFFAICTFMGILVETALSLAFIQYMIMRYLQ